MSSFPAGLHELASTHYDPFGADEPESFWASGPDEETVERVERLLSRIPPKWALHARMSLDGVTQVEAARRVGLSQPQVCWLRRQATVWLAWAATTLPDLTSEEVLDVLMRAEGIRPKDARIASIYWSVWDSTRCGVPQGTAYTTLFGRRQWDRGISHLLARRDGVEGEVGRGLLAIRDRLRSR